MRRYAKVKPQVSLLFLNAPTGALVHSINTPNERS
jgi:hypothetical protein